MSVKLGLIVVALALLGACRMAPPGPPTEPVRRIGFLASGGAMPTVYLAAFQQGLRAHGYVEGRTVAVEVFGDGSVDQPLGDVAAELARARVDVVVAVGPPAVAAAREATATIPIVAIGLSSDPVGLGLVDSLARPGGNVTGVLVDLPELSAKRLEVLTETLPGLERVAVLWNPDQPAHAATLAHVERVAAELSVTLQPLPARGPKDYEAAVVAAADGRAGALLVLHDTPTFAHRAELAAMAATQGLPTMYGFREWAEAGGLVAYGPSLREAHIGAADTVDRLLRGARVAELPIRQPTQLELVINLRASEALGLTISRSALRDATDVIR